MLSSMQQKLIIRMFGFWLRREVWTLSEFKDHYKSQPSYYFSSKQLENKDIISPLRDDYIHGEKKFYTLTPKGIMLARILCTFPENPEDIRSLSNLNLHHELDMNIFSVKQLKKGGKKNATR